MKKIFIVSAALILFAALLASCMIESPTVSESAVPSPASPTPTQSEPVTTKPGGEEVDWRTTGIVDGYVTFHDGTTDIVLALCIDEGKVSLYYDSVPQRLFAPAFFVSSQYDDNSSQTGSITFFDYDGDGCDELTITYQDDGSLVQDDWRWNKAAGTFEPFTPEPVFTQINPYVIEAETKAFLSDEEITYFQIVLDGIFAQSDAIQLTDDYDANLRIMLALMGSPYYFFVEDDWLTDDHCTMMLTYKYSAAEQEEMRQFINSEYLRILNSIIPNANMNDVEKTMAVYRYFSENISYDYDWVDGLNMSDEKYLYPGIEVYQALSTGKGVCHTYTYLCEFALQQLGVECLRMTGIMGNDSEVSHMWLVVKLNEHYYHCDPTWQSTSDNPGGLGYFGQTDRERWELGLLIECVGIDSAYGEFSCNDETFLGLRDVIDFSIGPNHMLNLTYSDGSTGVWDTTSLA